MRTGRRAFKEYRSATERKKKPKPESFRCVVIAVFSPLRSEHKAILVIDLEVHVNVGTTESVLRVELGNCRQFLPGVDVVKICVL